MKNNCIVGVHTNVMTPQCVGSHSVSGRNRHFRVSAWGDRVHVRSPNPQILSQQFGNVIWFIQMEVNHIKVVHAGCDGKFCPAWCRWKGDFRGCFGNDGKGFPPRASHTILGTNWISHKYVALHIYNRVSLEWTINLMIQLSALEMVPPVTCIYGQNQRWQRFSFTVILECLCVPSTSWNIFWFGLVHTLVHVTHVRARGEILCVTPCALGTTLVEKQCTYFKNLHTAYGLSNDHREVAQWLYFIFMHVREFWVYNYYEKHWSFWPDAQ